MLQASAVLLESSDINVRGAGLGLAGGIVFTAVVVAVILLVRNMNMRIKRLPEDFDDAATPPADGPGKPGPDDESDAVRRDGG
jgi:hypothetical protein